MKFIGFVSAVVALAASAPAELRYEMPFFFGTNVNIGCSADRSAGQTSDYRKTLEEAAVRNFRKGAEQGDPQFQFYLALRYYEGKGVEKNYKII